MKRINSVLLVLAMVWLIGCATVPQVEVGTMVHDVRVGYTDINEEKILKDIKPENVILSVNLPKAPKTVICFVFLSCPKGTVIHGVWWLNEKKLFTVKLKAKVNMLGVMSRFWYTNFEGIPSGEWKFDILISGKQLDSVKFTIQ